MEKVPASYYGMDEERLRRRIRERKEALGPRLVILGHHYQTQAVIDFADFRGDSLALCRLAAGQRECEFIVFCGVRFMAESAEILRAAHQVVQHPDPEAGCPMADMGDIGKVEDAWRRVTEGVGESGILPVTYMNSSAELKAFCGRHGGTVCTSSNADKVLNWAYQRADRVFFFPDEHLGRNTARRIGIPAEQILLWEPRDPMEQSEGAAAKQALGRSRLLLWKGHCHVHQSFRVDHVRRAGRQDPGAKVVVHPECAEDVVQAADACGSTEYICRFVAEAPSGATIYVGTESRLVRRLAREHPDKRILELADSTCPDMSRIDLTKLLFALDGAGQVNRVSVPAEIRKEARTALERMLSLPA
ncbi:MAG: quinolinate synthase NadA [bacterium]